MLYHYLVIHTKTGKQGIGESVPRALKEALGYEGHLRFVVTTPPRGFYWEPYQTRTLGSTAGQRRTVATVANLYEVCTVWLHNNPRIPNRKIMEVYRAFKLSTIKQLPDDSSTKTAKMQTNAKGNRKD